MHHRSGRAAFLGMLGVAALAACVASSPVPELGPGLPSDPPGAGQITMYAAGDLASCESDGDEATAALLDDLVATDPGSFLALGDLAYQRGSAEEFANCYEPSWGRHRERTIPTPGNHEYMTKDAAPYFNYFGPIAGESGQAWNAFEFRSWHLVVLDSNCDKVDCGAEARWLEESMAALSPGPGWCTLAIWHHPRWSSGSRHGSDPRTDTLWRILFEGGADVVLTAHDHDYERFVPVDAKGSADPDGMVEFVVGTGGRSLYEFGTILSTSAAHDNSTYGVLKLSLRAGAYDWAFVPTTDGGFTDSGTAACR